uniref:Uncharacterized protein n=1 Tax=Glossina pallidipes TaxID=7398 RepID=A0A1A9ZD71_GLOPL
MKFEVKIRAIRIALITLKLYESQAEPFVNFKNCVWIIDANVVGEREADAISPASTPETKGIYTQYSAEGEYGALQAIGIPLKAVEARVVRIAQLLELSPGDIILNSLPKDRETYPPFPIIVVEIALTGLKCCSFKDKESHHDVTLSHLHEDIITKFWFKVQKSLLFVLMVYTLKILCVAFHHT